MVYPQVTRIAEVSKGSRMRFRLTDGHSELDVIEANSAEDLAMRLALVNSKKLNGRGLSTHVQVHLWHSKAWWNLSDDLSQFCLWLTESERATREETLMFAQAPLGHPAWLFEAAVQMRKLLDIATANSAGVKANQLSI